MCGKNELEMNAQAMKEGSPPRVREELNQTGETAVQKGITPACAGRTVRRSNGDALAEDHPRVCGKNFFIL